MTTTPADLLAAAEYFTSRQSCECDHEVGITNCIGCDIDRMARHILATVHPDDAEPVTVEKMVAMGAVEWPAGRELYWPKTRLRYAMDIGWKEDAGFYVLNDNGHVVYLRDTKTMGQLRHLLAGLGMESNTEGKI